MPENNEKQIQRRQFIATAAKAGLTVTAAVAASYLLYDNNPPGPDAQAGQLVTVPDFSVASEPGKAIAIVEGSDRASTVSTALDLIGGIERFVKPGETVLIKPNIAFASAPMIGATTNPELVARVAKLCYTRGRAKAVYVTDNPINDPASCFRYTGIAKAAQNAGAKIILPKNSYFANTTLPQGKLIRNWPVLFDPLAKADKLIGISPVKDHRRSGASMTMKNFYGLLGGARNIFHQDINTIIVELAMLVKPTLVILDGTETMVTNGPTGGSTSDLKKTHTMIVSTDPVAADAFGCSLLGMKPQDLPYLAMAQAAGAGTTDYNSLKPIRGAASNGGQS